MATIGVHLLRIASHLNLPRPAALALLTAAAASALVAAKPDAAPAATEQRALGALPLTIPTYRFGIVEQRYGSITTDEVARGTTLSELLQGFDAGPDVTANVQATALQIMDAGDLVAERPLTVFRKTQEAVPDYVVYEPNGYEQIVFNFVTGEATKREEEVLTEVLELEGVVESNLWNAVTDRGGSPKLALGVQRAIETAVSLRSLAKGDKFTAVYERKSVNGQDLGVGRVKAVRLEHGRRDIIALHFEDPAEGINGYYSVEGENMRSGFLLSPVPGARISSAYNLRRFHPVLKRRKPHYGTDYAARTGTPIVAVADGKVVKVSSSRGNGKFVKIKHDDTYSTQYLHMSRHVKGMRAGDYVTQGQTIGYVGSTGLATGPHVCFRFWKHGKQVNHLNQELPKGQPLPEHLIGDFEVERDELLRALDYDYEAARTRVVGVESEAGRNAG